jgi:tetratricopeptide (TPR) repeat protein
VDVTRTSHGPAETTFIVGAGASVAPPASLPLFAAIRRSLIGQLGVTQQRAVEVAETLAPETFMRCLHDGKLPLQEWLTETLDRGDPNAIHQVLAAYLRGGATVWTVNVDELIEVAAGNIALVSAFDEKSPAARANVVKPHGTVSRGRYVFRSDQVIEPLAPSWADRLIADCTDRRVVLVGYAGLDIDLRLVLNAALAGAADVKWFEVEANREGLCERIPSLKNFNTPFAGGNDPRTLSSDFLAWSDAEGLGSSVSPDLRLKLGEDREPTIPAIEGDLRFARGLLLERIGDRKAARIEYRRVAHSRKPCSSEDAAHKAQTIAFYDGAWWTKPLIWWSAGPLASVMPARIRGRVDRVHVTRLSSHQGNHRAALRRASRVANPDDPAILIAKAKGARYTGDLSTALNTAERCEELARRSRSVDELAHALFEQAFAYTWAGNFVRARDILGELFSGIDGLAGVRWIAWALWQHACLAIYDNRPGRALNDLAQSFTLFESDYLPAGQVAALTVRLNVARLLHDDDLFERTSAEIDSMKGTPGWTLFTDASIGQERAEWLRIRGDRDAARELNDRVVRTSGGYPIHLGLALLRRAEMERVANENNEGTCREIRLLLDRNSMAYVDAHLGITEHLSGRASADHALRHVIAVCPLLATRTGIAATSPLDYCLGEHPDQHELFLP